MESNENQLLILAVVGMPASGKSEVLKTLVKDYDFYHLYYGDITFDEVKKRGLELTEENERKVREEFRAGGDMGIYSKLILPKIEQAIDEGKKRIILESMYNIYEYEIIKEKYDENFKVLAIHSDADVRLKRINSRKERKLTEEELNSRQISEAKKIQKGSVISIADYHYVNNGKDMKVFENDMQLFIKNKLSFNNPNFTFVKDYDKWNQIKKEINLNEKKFIKYPKIGEVWMASYGNNIGFEQDGSGTNMQRPVLVTKKFNNQMFLTVPLSTKQKKLNFYYNFTDLNNLKVSFILAQVKLMSLKRFERKMYEIPLVELQKVNDKIKLFLDVDL